MQKELKEMIPLTRQEIYAALKKLGINTAPELKTFLREYYKYYVHPTIIASSLEESADKIKENQSR